MMVGSARHSVRAAAPSLRARRLSAAKPGAHGVACPPWPQFVRRQRRGSSVISGPFSETGAFFGRRLTGNNVSTTFVMSYRDSLMNLEPVNTERTEQIRPVAGGPEE